MSAVLDLALIITGLGYVSFAPFTKVEEIFNLHATHDVLMYGVGAANLPKGRDASLYDHFTLPGAVTRLFVGSVLLAWRTWASLRIGSWLVIFSDKFDVQVLLRIALGSWNATGLCMLRRAVSRRFGRPTSILFVLLTITQFHLPFWMSRTLPNMFALLSANIALYHLVDRTPNSTRPSISSAHPSGIHYVCLPLRTPSSSWASGITGCAVVLLILRHYKALTTLVDSYFWQQWPLWPELYGIYFNVSPFHAYHTSYLPKLLLSSLPLSAFGLLSDSRIRALLIPYLAFILLISGLAYKEWRFVIFIVPAFNIAAARGAAWLTSRRKGSLFGRLCFIAVVACVAANCAVTFLLARSSFANYPGGAALRALNQIYASEENVHVHICNLAAQTGASRFLHNNAPPFLPSLNSIHHTSWVYDKTENLTLDDLTRSEEITHLIVEASSVSPSALAAKGWTAVAVVE
ncbi:hypothetical protein C8Q74DRAFT_1455380 [Fomes fomentarius]|nr:hypothetical protein C8Q74DRAFT_1455380 [Fomes fomentarius]